MTRDIEARASWAIGFPPYDTDRTPRRYLPERPSGRSGFPPYGEYELDERAPYDTAPRIIEDVGKLPSDQRMLGFPPYNKAPGPHDSETIGLPPYNSKPPRTRSYLKPDSQHAPGFPPYNRVPTYRRSLEETRRSNEAL